MHSGVAPPVAEKEGRPHYVGRSRWRDPQTRPLGVARLCVSVNKVVLWV